MCLIIAHRNLKTIPTHKEGEPCRDRKVYKILLFDGEAYTSPFVKPFKWTLGEVITDPQEPNIQTVKSKKRGWNYRIVREGFFHAYTNPKSASDKVVCLLAEEITQKYLSRTRQSLVIKEAIIPEGTKYYEGTKRDICAKSLKILDKDVPILESNSSTGS